MTGDSPLRPKEGEADLAASPPSSRASHSLRHHPEVVSDLFRHEAGRLTASLVRILGASQYEVAEEIVQETLLLAFERWKYGAVPDNPAAWLTRAAKNRAIDILRKRTTAKKNAHEVAANFQLKALEQSLEARFAAEVDDDVLRMMFSCCAPPLSRPAQIALILKSLCGFSTGEIAAALLVKPSAVERRLSRAKAALREHGLYDVTDGKDLQSRLGAVHQAIYLLFNEGYHGAHQTETIRFELCREAIRLGAILLGHDATCGPKTHALMALMCLLSARLSARTDENGELLALRDQDRRRWNGALIRAGLTHLDAATAHDDVSAFHLEASLASVHALAPSWDQTDWARLVSLYDLMVQLHPTDIVKLNRAIAIGHMRGAAAGLTALRDVDVKALAHYPFLPAARAEFLVLLARDAKDREETKERARQEFTLAIALARSPVEKRYFLRRREAIGDDGDDTAD